MALSVETEGDKNENTGNVADSSAAISVRETRRRSEWKWLCNFYHTAVKNALRTLSTNESSDRKALKPQNRPIPPTRGPTCLPVQFEYSRPRTWSDGNVKYIPGQESPVDVLCKHHNIKPLKYVRVVRDENKNEEEKYELSPYETPVWPREVIVVHYDGRCEQRLINSDREIPPNAKRIEIQETEIQQFAREITHPSTLTFKLIYHVFGTGRTGEWLSAEGADKPMMVALDRLVRITNSPLYRLEFKFEHRPPCYYKVIKLPPRQDAEENGDQQDAPTDEDIRLLENEEAQEQNSKPDDSQNEKPILTEELQKHIEKFSSSKTFAYNQIFRNLMLGYDLLTHEEEVNLANQAHEGDQKAFHKLVMSNARLVASILKKRHGILRNHPDFWDLLAEGLMGIRRAVEKFEPERGWKFSTYATWWVHHAVNRARSDAYYRGTVRLPVHMVDFLYNLRGAIKKLMTENGGKQPTVTEIAQCMEVTEDKVKKLMETRRMQASAISISAFSDRVEEDDRGGLLDTIMYRGGAIADERAVLDQKIGSEQTIETILDAIDYIPSVYRNFGDAGKIRYLLMRYYSATQTGDNPEKARATLEDIGDEFGITRERVRQMIELITAALRKYIKPEQVGLDMDKSKIRRQDTQAQGFITK